METILNIFKATLSSVPLGGGVASLLTDYIPSRRFRRVEAFARAVAEDLERVNAKVDEQRLQTDEFVFIFERAFKGAAEHYQQEKLDAFRGVLVNAAISQDLAQDEKEYFLSLVTTLSVLHLRILQFLTEPRAFLAVLGIDEHQLRGGFAQMFKTVMPQTNQDVLRSAFSELYQLGLIDTDKSIFSTMTSNQGLALLVNRVTPFGKAFIEFLRPPPRPQ